MKIMQTIAKILMPLILGGAILYWMYRGEDWQSIKDVMLHEMNWTWMLLSFPFGILAQADAGADRRGASCFHLHQRHFPELCRVAHHPTHG